MSLSTPSDGAAILDLLALRPASLARFALAAVALLVAPGWSWARRAGPPEERAMWAAGIALSAGAGLGLLLQATGGGLRPLPFLLLAFFVAGVVWDRRAGAGGGASKGERSRSDGGRAGGRGPAIAVGILLLVAMALPFLTARFPELKADDYDYVATLQAIRQEGTILPLDPFHGEGPGPDPRRSAYHTLAALVATSAGVHGMTAWAWLPALLVPFRLAAVGALARRLLPGRWTPALAMALALLLQDGGVGGALLERGAYASRAAGAVYLLFLVALLDGKPALAGLLAAGAALLHVQWLVLVPVAGAALLLATPLLGPRGAAARRDLLRAAIWGAPAAVALALARWRLFPPLVNPAHLHDHGLLTLAGPFFWVVPEETWRWMGAASVAGILAWPLLARRARAGGATGEPGDRPHDDGLARAVWMFAALLAAPLLTSANPLASPLLWKPLSYLVARIPWILPVPALAAAVPLAWGGVRDAGRGPAGGRGERWGLLARRALATTATVALLASVAGGLARLPRPFREDRAPLAAWAPALATLRALPPGTVLSDPVTAYAVPALAGKTIVGVLEQHSSPADPHALERLRDNLALLSPYLPNDERLALLRKRRVRYLLVNASFSGRMDGYYLSYQPEATDALLAWADEPGGPFRRIAAWGGGAGDPPTVVLYETRDPLPEADEMPPLPPNPYVDAAPSSGGPSAAGGEIVTFERSVRLLAARAEKAGAGRPASAAALTLSAGDTLAVTCSWALAPGAALPPIELVPRVYLRADAEVPGGGRRDACGSKLRRGLLERRRHERYRFRRGYPPAHGVYPPDRWRAGEVVTETYLLAVPSLAAAGAWTLTVDWKSSPILPNRRLRDLVSDADWLDGAPAGRFRVEGGAGGASE